MRKLFVLSALSIFLCSCSLDIRKEGANIKSMYFDHVPEQAIKIGEFDGAGILLHVEYSDKSRAEFPVTESWLPQEYLHYLGEPGTYSVRILFRGKETTLNFTMESNPDAPKYNVAFLNREGKVIESYLLSHRLDAVYHGFLEEGFLGWDQSLYGVCKDMVYSPIFA